MTEDRDDTDFHDLARLLAFGKELGRMGSWEVSYDEAGKPRTRWSPECYEILGIQPELLEGTIDGFLERIHRFDVDRVRAVVTKSQPPGPLPELDFRIVRADGSQSWITLRGEVFPDGRVIGLVQDVTAQRVAKEELARNDQGLRALFESSSDGLILWNDVLRIVDVNDAACEIYGLPRDDLIGSMMGAQSTPRERNLGGPLGLGDHEMLERFQRGEIVLDARTIVRTDGSVRQIDTTGIPNFLGEKLNLAIIRDVTDREQAAEALRAAEARYRSLVEDMPLVTYILGPAKHATPLYASPRAEKLLGYPTEEWTRRPDFQREIVHFDDRVRVEHELVSWEEHEPLDREYRVVATDQSIIWVLDRMVAVRDEEGQFVCYQGFLLDITRRKELEEQLQQSQRLETIGRLAGGIAHDFNNLLTAINGYSSLALERIGQGDARLRRDVEQIRESAERAASLTQQLLAFSRRQVLQPRALDLNAVVADVRALLERLIGDDVELATELEHEGAVHVSADPGRLEQVLVNLAVNARDSMPDGGTITIAVCETEIGDDDEASDWGAPPGRYPTLVVRDTGHGMDPDTLRHAFEPFFTTKDVGLGTGLGLSTAYGIVKQSGGWIALESEQGVGTTAKIYLPRTTKPPERPAEPTVEPPATTGTILLVEDEAIVRDLVAEMLAQRGYGVIEAEGPLEAIELARDGKFDLLLTDVVMPKLNGRELARRLRATRPSLHVVYTSGYAPEAVLDGGRLDPGEFFMQKPFTAVELGAIVREALDAAATQPS